MDAISAAVDRIKALECPAGEVQERLAQILSDYGAVPRNKLDVHRDHTQDKDGAKAYRAAIQGSRQSVLVWTKSGMDDYVATVVDANIGDV